MPPSRASPDEKAAALILDLNGELRLKINQPAVAKGKSKTYAARSEFSRKDFAAPVAYAALARKLSFAWEHDMLSEPKLRCTDVIPSRPASRL